MDTIKKSRLIESLLPYKQLIHATNKKSYILKFHQYTSELSTLNQIAGQLFVDRYNSIPKDYQGKDKLLLAQIDFNEIPLQQPFPQNGVVQFFVNEDFGKYHFPKQNEQFFIRYIEQSLINDDGIVYTSTNRIVSVPIPYKFTGILIEEPVSSFDYRFETYFKEVDKIISVDERTFHEIYTMAFLGAEHKIGGYPYFIHEDFRSKHPHLKKYDTLLFQLVTDDEYAIGYRDSGVISFFIEEEKLLNKDFTDVYMHTEHY